MADPIPAINAQNFFNPHAVAQLEISPQFSNNLSEEKFTAAHGLLK
jgi:hypothetical protein